MKTAYAALFLVACVPEPTTPTVSPAASASPASSATPDVATAICATYGYAMMGAGKHYGPGETPFDTAQAAADADVSAADAAGDKGDYITVARAYLACAGRFRSVPDADPNSGIALGNARVCYYNAIYAFANANRFAAEGKAALERAAKDDPKNAAYIQSELAKAPGDCKATP